MTETREIKAAVVREGGAPLELETLTLREIGPNDIEVRLVASGVCHTDMYVRDQNYPVALPAVLGHEGSGVVERIGDQVTTVAPGDHVVLSFLSCGNCSSCLSGRSAYCHHAFDLNFDVTRSSDLPQTVDAQGDVVHDAFFGQSSFRTRTVVDARSVVKVPHSAPLELLGPLGCGIQTGAGAVLNTFKVPAGSKVVVFGAGAVGLSAVMAAKVAGATTIVAVDIVAERLSLAEELGATAVVNPIESDTVAALREISPAGFDYSFDTTGRTDVVEQAIDVLGIQGSCGVIGVPPFGARASFDAMALFATGRTIRGIVAGDSVPQNFVPTLVQLYEQGKFPFDKLVQFYEFDQINEAIEDSEKGRTVKPILRMPPS